MCSASTNFAGTLAPILAALAECTPANKTATGAL
jgi:hypothetical protein